MNSLNLRVSSIKTGENIKKNSEMRTGLISITALPKKYYGSDADFVNAFAFAKSVPEQVAGLKKVVSEHSASGDSAKIQFLSDLYFHAPLKHAVRNQAAKKLQQYEKKDKVVAAMAKSIQEMGDNVKVNWSCTEANRFITSLSGCFENFPEALQALEPYLDQIFSFLWDAVVKLLKELKNHSSPSIQNELYLFLHNAVRLMLSCVQCVQEFPETLFKDQKHDIDTLKAISWKIIKENEVPMDIKTNCGILTAYLYKNTNNYKEFASKMCVTPQFDDCQSLCLCIGYVNTVKTKDLNADLSDILNIVTNIIRIGNEHSMEPIMLLAATRSLHQMSKVLLTLTGDAVLMYDAEEIEMISRMATDYVYSYLEHHMDSVRHICKDILQNIIRLTAKYNLTRLLDEVFAYCKSDATPLSAKCIILTAAGVVLGSKNVLTHMPDLFSAIFLHDLGGDLNVNNCFETLMIANRKEVDFDEWTSVWFTHLATLSKTNDKNKLGAIEILINKCLKCEPKVFDSLFKEDTINLPLSTCCSVLWTVRKNGLVVDGFDSIFQRLFDDMRQGILSNCDDTKVMILRLLVESHKTTEVFREIECQLLLLFVEYNANCQSPATRQKMVALFLKSFNRVEASLPKITKANKDHYYFDYLRDLFQLLTENFFPGANFSRRSVSLQLLKELIALVLRTNLGLERFTSKNISNVILTAFKDSYEANKALAVDVIKLLKEYSVPDFQELKNMDSKGLALNSIKELMISVRPTDSNTAAYYLESLYICSDDESGFVVDSITTIPTYDPILYCTIKWVIEELESGLNLAKRSILSAAKQNPLYGCVFAIRHLLEKVEFQKLSTDQEWKELISSLIVLCKKLTQVVAPIVNSSSPEGHLPNDFSEVPNYLHTNGDIQNHGKFKKVLSSKNFIHGDELKVTPQTILLCGWRTIKEVSLLLGDIVLHSPIKRPDENTGFLITKEEVLGIGDHFKELLEETKHRGAFEQAYVGFLKLCTRLWRVQQADLNALPLKWLEELMDIISNDERVNEKICATRRSAGVPFMVQALITSELQVGTKKALAYCMQHLISICQKPHYTTESKTHSLNILRALFKCTDLCEAVGEFVADGIKCAIRGYNSNTWAERNSSTLLFSALITRVFGVQRTKDSENLNIRNKMTGRIFFLRYPELYDFFLVELNEASELISREENASKLHPLLLILSRLYPSALEGTESNLKLSAFVPYVSVCSKSPDMQTRILTAKAISAFISVDGLENRIRSVLQIIKNICGLNEGNSTNYIHGLFLQILFLLKHQKRVDNLFGEEIIMELLQLENCLTRNAIILTTAFNIFIEVFKSCDLNGPTTPDIISLISVPHKCFYYPVLKKSMLILSLHLAKKHSLDHVTEILISTLSSNVTSFEEMETCLNVVLLIFQHSSDDFEFSRNESDFVRGFDENQINYLQKKLRNELQSSFSPNKIIENKKFYPECTIKAYTMFSEIPHAVDNLEDIIKTANLCYGAIKDAVAQCIERYCEKDTLKDDDLDLCLKFLEESSQSWNSDLLRLTSSKILRTIAKNLLCQFDKQNKNFIITFYQTTILLLNDDDSDVRDSTAFMVTELCRDQMSPKSENLVASYAQTLFIRMFANQLKEISDKQFVMAVITELRCDQNVMSCSANSSENENEFEVFDRNEANIFGELERARLDFKREFLKIFNDDAEILSVIS